MNRQHMAEKNSLSWWAVGSAVLILGGGILIQGLFKEWRDSCMVVGRRSK